MLVLKSLSFQNIGRFIEPQTIDFTQLGSLVQVDGSNLNTGGSSGSGKSTIFKALEFLLGLNDISNGVLQSRLTKEPMFVTGHFGLDGRPLKIERGKKLLIDLDGEITFGSSKLTEEKLDEILGMSRDLFRKIMHKRQGEGGFFLQMTPSEVHKFLTSVLGLEKEQSKVLTLDDRLSILTKNDWSLKSELQSSQMGLQATQDAISSLGPKPVLEVDPGAMEALKTKHLEVIDHHTLVKNGHKVEMEDLEKTRPKVTVNPFDRTNIIRLEDQIKVIDDQVTEFQKVELDRQSEVKSKISELQILSSNLINSELTRQSEVKNQISTIQMEVVKIEGMERVRQSTVKDSISSLQIEIIKNKAIVDLGIKSKQEAILLVRELQKVRSSECPTCSQSWITEECKTKESQILASISEHKKNVIAGNNAGNKITLDSDKIRILTLELESRVTLETRVLNEKILQLRPELQPQVVPEVVELSYKIEFLKQEAQPRLMAEVVELSRHKFVHNSMLGIERKEEIDHQFRENAKNEATASDWQSKYNELRKTHDLIIRSVQDDEYRALSAYETAKGSIKAFEDAKTRFEESLRRLNEQLDKYKDQLVSKTLELGLVTEEIVLALESKKAIKSYLSCSFEDALDSIGEAATKLIRGIPNMETATIQLEGLKETKDGKVKEDINAVISMDGEIGIPVKSLSGGERSSVDIGIDLSVVAFIEERTGLGVDLMILDEFTNGLDTVCIENAIEMLKNSNIGKRLLLVEHNPIISQMIENKLTVIRDGQTSRVVQQ